MWQAGLLCAPDIPPRHNMAPSGISANTQCPLPTGAVRRASGAGQGWAIFQTTGCLGCSQNEIEGGKKIREEIETGD